MPDVGRDRENGKDRGEAARAEADSHRSSGPTSSVTEFVIPNGLPPETLETLNNVWKDACKPQRQPEMTIRPDSRAPMFPETTLIIKERTLRTTETPGTTDAEYELLKVLGEGGMGIVYNARQASIDRLVAVKMLHNDTSLDTDQRRKFLLEAVITADLDHPNIVPVYDLGSSKKGAPFYSMKRVWGTPWKDLFEQKSLDQNVEILLRVADAVAFAHARGVVHRDLKPENVMLGEFGEVLVMDWGLAHPTASFERGGITGSSGLGGTPVYMAPELVTGPVSIIGPAADIYLLGAILYEIITGKPPHQGKNVMECLMVAARNEIAPTDESGELMDIARKAMATAPEERHATVRELQSTIREFLSHAESNLFSERAEKELERARGTDEYPDYAKALFAFEEACSLWEGNSRARSGLADAKLAYAQSALARGDYDLSGSLLDPVLPDHGVLRAKVEQAKIERRAQLQRLRRRQLATGVLCVCIGVLVVLGVVVTVWLRQSNLRLADLHAPAVHESTVAQIGLERSVGALRGWVVLGNPRFKSERKEAWKGEIRPAIERLGLLVQRGANPQNKERLEELTSILAELEEAQWWTEDAAQTPGNEPARLRYQEHVEPVRDDILRTVATLIELERASPDGTSRKWFPSSIADLRNALVLSGTELVAFLLSGLQVNERGFQGQLQLAKERTKAISDRSELLTGDQRDLMRWVHQELPVFERLARETIAIRKSDRWNIAQHRLRDEAVPLGRRASALLGGIGRTSEDLMQENVSNVSMISTAAAVVSSVLAAGAFAITWLVSRGGIGRPRGEGSGVAPSARQVEDSHAAV